MKAAFDYDPITGEIRWAIRPAKNVAKGSLAGKIQANGYRRIRYQGKDYLAHRLAWYLYYGDWPSKTIDHLDGNKLNNSISNLEDVSMRINTVRRSSNTELPTGVCRQNGRYRAQKWYQGKNLFLGYYNTPEEAHQAYLNHACNDQHPALLPLVRQS
jgi:hypothetical protein